MDSILTKLFYGNIEANIQCCTKDLEYENAVKVISDNEEKLTNLLQGEEKELFLQLINAQSNVNGYTALNKFIYGFKLGVQIILEGTEGKCHYED